jgi:peptidoglycan-associated lipoprotein
MSRAWVLTLLLVLGVSGCKHWKNGECESNDNCKDQEGYGKFCVQGHCQECGSDVDCKSGFVCRAGRCVPRPECGSAVDCARGQMCVEGRCVADPDACSPGVTCSGGRGCVEGRCVAAVVPPAKGPCDELRSVYFDFDKALLSEDARRTLEKNVRCLASPSVHLVVIGNCDERGTEEYNLHLGQRRADAVKKYLMGLGVARARVSTLSFGRERPVCMEANEACWQKNRRADVQFQR